MKGAPDVKEAGLRERGGALKGAESVSEGLRVLEGRGAP